MADYTSSKEGAAMDLADTNVEDFVGGGSTEPITTTGLVTLASLLINGGGAEATIDGFLTLGDASILILSANTNGVVTATSSYHVMDTFAAAASGDCITINGGAPGRMLILHGANSARDVTLKDAVDNLQIAGDFTFASSSDIIFLFGVGTNSWREVGRSANV